MRIICAAYTVWYSLRSINPLSPFGWMPVSGHEFVGEVYEDLTCERCGHVEPETR